MKKVYKFKKPFSRLSTKSDYFKTRIKKNNN